MRGYARLPLTVCLLALTACAGGGAAPGGPAPDVPTGRTFLSTSVTDAGTAKELAGGTRIRLTFDGEGGVAAHAGCNHIRGKVRLDGARLVVTELGSTEMACAPELMAQDDWLSKLLTATPTWHVSGNDLVLRTGGTEVKLQDRVVADPDRPLAGTRWEVDSIISKDAAGSVPTDVQAHLTFAPDGKVSGSTGCNSFSTTATVEGLKITFQPVVTTKIACPGAANDVELAVLRVLGQPVTYRIEAGALTFTAADGSGLRLTAT